MKVFLKDIKINGDPFYTNSVQYYIHKLDVDSVASVEELEILKSKVLRAADADAWISDKVRKSVINAYFDELAIELRKPLTKEGKDNDNT